MPRGIRRLTPCAAASTGVQSAGLAAPARIANGCPSMAELSCSAADFNSRWVSTRAGAAELEGSVDLDGAAAVV
ncbi:hypothetical protein [Streptomyces longispororuber]|uniref:hypothetical protein n=1 Tax=Streptomyces longispororuber TaxID=68230 RepID=UPI00210AE114|nr:hypothetical protein [Streptomyces longispororuber]MCQ4212935.1 hypothetical protein [Streptomyces longispororuber]